MPFIPHFPPHVPTEEEIVLQQMQMGEDFWKSCPVKGVLAGGAGFVLGGAFSLLMGSMAYDVPVGLGGQPLSTLPLKEQMRVQARELGGKMWGSAKSFGKIGGIFSSVECSVEALRAKNDIWNGIASGCMTGGALAIKSGPQAALSGCAAFAAFSGAIDLYMRKDERPPADNDED
ncbi:Tim17/Tim22/Tim23/Pmp24 family-domain-containing protein [Lipomyces arxii]|uniref:Tim17/Tim22/Tim23/Pmp24 family-domain-containing protein n=1 Tax=Lipomyces arxii TaxID=56418 RepID=UPI0034CE8C61